MPGMIGPAHRTTAINALIGPGHSAHVPETLWGGFLDASGVLVAMTGVTVPHAAFSPVTGGMGNSAEVDAGVAGAGWSLAWFALFDAESGGDMVVAADITDDGTPIAPAEYDVLVFDAGELTFTTSGWTP